MKVKFIQIAVNDDYLLALDEEGQVWRKPITLNKSWAYMWELIESPKETKKKDSASSMDEPDHVA